MGYLVKYIAKVEPTFGLRVEFSSEVQKYFEIRLIGAPEAIAITCSYAMVSCDTAVVYIDTNPEDKRFRVMKHHGDIQEQ